MNENPNIPEQYRTLKFDMQSLLEGVIKRHNIAVDALTEKQFVGCLTQAIASGDFQKLIISDGRQGMTYIPWRDVEKLKSRIRFLESLCEAHGLSMEEDQCDL